MPLFRLFLAIKAIQNSVPETAGVLLLPDTPLFPHCTMELHLFEQRYRKMMKDLLEEGWRLALGSVIQKESENLSQCVAPVGVLGVIRVAKQLPDGRYNVVLEGTHPVHFEEWDAQSPYPKATLRELERSPLEKSEESVRSLVLNAVGTHLEHLEEAESQKILSFFQGVEDFSQFIDTVSHHFVTDVKTRLELLSEPAEGKRASLLIRCLSA